ncbi:MAG: arsenate reductase ArsC [Planctomycetes bacterium]|nr:arsenate reductase ArsC [Planctomycetota bacterium]
MVRENILFVSTRNSCRSRMAEGILKNLAGYKYDCYSAGIMPKEINPYARQVMEEIGISMKESASHNISDYLGKKLFHNIIIIGRHADRLCPHIFPGMGERILWDINAPSGTECKESEKLARYRELRDHIEKRVKEWLEEQDKVTYRKSQLDYAIEEVERNGIESINVKWHHNQS